MSLYKAVLCFEHQVSCTVSPDVVFSLHRAGPFHSPKVQSSPFSHSSGSSKQKQSLLFTLQKPNASLSFKTNGLHSPAPKSSKSSSSLNSVVQEPDLSSPPAQIVSPNKKKKKKKKRKRQHSEIEADTKPAMPPVPMTQFSPVESSTEKKHKKKKKKKRKRENDDGEGVKERACVPSHLEQSNPDEEWCQGGMWSLMPHSDTEKCKQKALLPVPAPKLGEPHQEAVLKKKKKKKLGEALQDTDSACTASKR